MSEFQKLTIEVEALQWQGEEVPGFVRKQLSRYEDGRPYYQLVVPHHQGGSAYIRVGEWIVRGTNGYHIFPENTIKVISR